MRKFFILLFSFLAIIILAAFIYYFTKPNYGTIEITSNLKSVELSIDENKKSIDPPYRERVLVGQHSLRVSMNNYSPFEKTITIERNKTANVDISLISTNESAEEEETSSFFNKNTLIKYLPASGEYFKIDFYQKGTSDIYYKIILSPKTDPKNKEGYKKELQDYKNKVLIWIKSKNINPDELNIEWTPQEVVNI